MKVATLEMSRAEAQAEVSKWRIGRTMRDQLITKAFRSIARGEKVLDLYKSFEIGGVDVQGRPMLVIARADSEIVNGWVGQHTGGMVTFRSRVGNSNHNSVQVPNTYLPGLKAFDARARVPTIPPCYRKSNLSQYWILFEAAWQAVTKDPFLLEHLGGALYRVVAAWDLTPVEQVVLRGRSLV